MAMELDLFEYYKQARDNNILISFKGALSQEILVEMGGFIKQKISLSKKIKKIFAVFVEMAQNIMHYSEEREQIDDKKSGVGMILFTESKGYFHVFSGNLIKSDNARGISEKIDNINSLTTEELKEAYAEQRRKPVEEGSKGAGLGLMEIVRKANDSIDYKISYIDDRISFLELSVKINKE